MKYIAVLGSTGMAGHVASQYLEEQGYPVFRTSRSERDTETCARIDVTDFHALGDWLDAVQPEVVVNCVGLLQRACEQRRDLAVCINAYLPHWLEHRYADSPTKVIHLSTDCVFSGNHGGYKENDLADGRTMYDRSKALGELDNGKDLTFRMSIIGPDIDPAGTGLFNWFMQQTGTIQGYRKAIWNGVTTIELARAINSAICQDLTGVYHLVQPEPVDKYSLLCLMKRVFQRDDIVIESTAGVQADKSLINTRKDFVFCVKPYEEQLQEMKCWIQGRPSQYPHYTIR